MASSKGTAAADEKILSYNDVVLRRSDLDILRGPYYLNDRLIEFFFAHLAAVSSSADSPAASDRVLLVPPSISFWLANCPDSDSLLESIVPLHLSTKDLVLFTVNDNLDVTVAEGGSHWSLMVFHRSSNEFLHHDSSRGMNRRHAERLFEKVRGFVGGATNGDDQPRYVEAATPQQTNGYDCGVYVMAIARVVHNWFLNGGNAEQEEEEDRWFRALEEEVDADAVDELRSEVLRLILSLRERRG